MNQWQQVLDEYATKARRQAKDAAALLEAIERQQQTVDEGNELTMDQLTELDNLNGWRAR